MPERVGQGGQDDRERDDRMALLEERVARIWQRRADEIRALGLTPEEVVEFDRHRSKFLADRERRDDRSNG